MMIIPDVPDLQQPIDPWWGNLDNNACAPVSAANICVYWDDSIHHSNAAGLNSGLIADSVPSFLYYFMGTNGEGDTTRANPDKYGIQSGTITMDIDTGFEEYVRWDALNLFLMPKPFNLPSSKKGFDWTISRDVAMGFEKHRMEIDMRRPDILVFKYWNPVPTGEVMPSEMGGEDIHFFLWDAAVPGSGPPNPEEEWYFDEKLNSVGHAVTGVGYIPDMDPDDAGPLPLTNWIICHDNWSTTPVNVAIPWVDSLWIATITADPGPDTIVPFISCMDTTVYLDENGQFHLDESYIVDSVWDNNGVEQLFLDEYYVMCYNTGTPKTVTATAMDMFFNMGQCSSSVTVLDTIRPVAVCRDTTVYLDAGGNAGIDSSYVDDGSSDNCSVSTITLSRSSFNCTDVGSNPVDVTITDASSNSIQCQVAVTVLDTIRPVAVCRDTTVYLDAGGNAGIDSSYVDDGSSDNCCISSILLGNYHFTCGHTGDNNVSVTVNDENGNSSSCNVIVRVKDTISPVLICTDTTIYLDSTGSFTIDSSYVMTVSDNCGILSTTLSRYEFDKDDLTDPQPVSITVYDESGNIQYCDVSVTVMDTISTGLHESIAFKSGLDFRIIPNPSEGIFRVESRKPVTVCTLELYSIKGVLLRRKIIHDDQAELNLVDFRKGVYFIRIRDNEGREFRDKIVIR